MKNTFNILKKVLIVISFCLAWSSYSIDIKNNKPQYKHVIWEGRFQPFHNGHLEYIRKLKSISRNLWVVVLANETSNEILGGYNNLPTPQFTKEVDPHHRKSKNPLPHWLRFMIVKNSIEEAFGLNNNIYITMGHRLDLDWKFYKKNLPTHRVFITPLRDPYEDSKAKAWKKLGEECIRLDISDLPDISATQVRDHIKKGGKIKDLVPKAAIRVLKQENYWNKFIKSVKNG